MFIKYINLVIIVSVLTLLAFISCNRELDRDAKDEYTVKPKDRFILYGVDVKKILYLKFSDIEKKLGTETQIDKEVEVVFIRKRKDFAVKNQSTEIKDYINIIYGPVEDLTIYEKYKEISPYTIGFYGGFSINERIDTKATIIKELEKNLPKDDTTKRILDQIRQRIIMGSSDKRSGVTIKFEMPEFPVAEFYVGFFKNEITYKYTFSKMKEIYP